MEYPFITLDDGTQISHSEMLADHNVQVYIRRDALFHAVYVLPAQKWREGAGFILFSNSTDTSACAFSTLASAHSIQRSAATPHFIRVSQNEKFASHLVPFSSENSMRIV